MNAQMLMLLLVYMIKINCRCSKFFTYWIVYQYLLIHNLREHMFMVLHPSYQSCLLIYYMVLLVDPPSCLKSHLPPASTNSRYFSPVLPQSGDGSTDMSPCLAQASYVQPYVLVWMGEDHQVLPGLSVCGGGGDW